MSIEYMRERFKIILEFYDDPQKMLIQCISVFLFYKDKENLEKNGMNFSLIHEICKFQKKVNDKLYVWSIIKAVSHAISKYFFQRARKNRRYKLKTK